jgi:Nif-specific regulatory protein
MPLAAAKPARPRNKKKPAGPAQADADELRLLFEISELLGGTLDLSDIGEPVLALLATHTPMQRGVVRLLDAGAGELVVEAAWGLSKKQRARAQGRVGEGVIGRVVEKGRPAVVLKEDEAPHFLPRTKKRALPAREEIGFFCVPVVAGGEVVGALTADRVCADPTPPEQDVRLLSIIASMVARAAQLRQTELAERRALEEENARLQGALKDRFRPANIVSSSSEMQVVYDLIAQVADRETSVLVRGESGTGKELVAHALHYHSPRAGKPFVQLNCAALPDSLLESELFGHERGAFTGAVQARKGRFELAHGGTLFLDEVGDLSPLAQSKLLRVLQERRFERVGGQSTHEVDVRLIAATHRDLEELVEQGSFRADLYYRLNVYPIHVPPLRERPSDVLLLVDHFVERYAQQSRKRVRRVSTPAIDALVAYHWPGNVRELENTIERAVLLTTEDVIRSHHLPPTLQMAEDAEEAATDLVSRVDAFERELVIEALKSARGNRAQAARALGISERIMGLRVDKYDIDARSFRRRSA